MLIDVRNLKEVEKVSGLVKTCYMKALKADETVKVCIDVLTASPDLVKLVGNYLPHRPKKEDILDSLLSGRKVEVSFVNAKAKTAEEMNTISEFFQAYHKIQEYIETYTIDDVIRSGADIVKELNELGLYEAQLSDNDSKKSDETNTKEHKRKCGKRSVPPRFIDDFSRLCGVNFNNDEVLKDFADKVLTGAILDFLANKSEKDDTFKRTESQEIADEHLKKCMELNMPTVMATSTKEVATFTFYRDGVLFELPLPIKELETLEKKLQIMLETKDGIGFFHTNVGTEDKVVHISLVGEKKQTLRLKVRTQDDTVGNVFSLHKSSKLLKQFRALLVEVIKANKRLGRC